MIFSIFSLAFMSLSTQNFHCENEEIEGNAYSDTQSFEVTGTYTSQYEATTTQGEYIAPVESVKDPNTMVEDTFAVSIRVLFPEREQKSELVTIDDVARLNIDGGTITLQPSRSWAYVNKAVYLQSDAKPVTKETTILGNTVTITATPISYTWHCGDGHSFTTKDAGGTWSHGGTASHSYTRAGTYTLNAEIVWQASYTVGGRTYPVNGTLTTTSTSYTIDIVEAETVLTN